MLNLMPRTRQHQTLPIYQIRHYKKIPCSSGRHLYRLQENEPAEEQLQRQRLTRRKCPLRGQMMAINV